MSTRLVFIFCLVFCAALLSGAAYLQYFMALEPCPMCIMQRWALIGLSILLVIAILHNPLRTGQRIYGFGVGVLALAGGSVAARQVWLQHLPAEAVPECGPGLNFILDTFPLTEALSYIFAGSGECATVDWTFLGQSLAVWSLCAFFVLFLAGISVLFRNGGDKQIPPR